MVCVCFFSKRFFLQLVSDYALNKLLKTKTRCQWQKNTSLKNREREKKFWCCEVFEMNLLIKCSYERNSSILPHVPLRLFITACFVLHIYSGHLKLPHHEHWVEKKYNDDDRMKQLPASNKDKVLNEDKPLHMNTDVAFFHYKVGFFFLLRDRFGSYVNGKRPGKTFREKKSTRCMWIGVNTSHKRTHKKKKPLNGQVVGKKKLSKLFFP